MAAQVPLDKRVFACDYDDVELLGKLATRGSEWPFVGFALHVQTGAIIGAAYSQLRPFMPGPAIASGTLVALVENFGLWPLTGLVDRHHPARGELPKLAGNRRALLQATWRHVVFGVALGALEAIINDRSADEPPSVPVSSNGHGNIEAAMTPA